MTLLQLDSAHAEGSYTTAIRLEAHAKGILPSPRPSYPCRRLQKHSICTSHAEAPILMPVGDASTRKVMKCGRRWRTSHAEGTNTTASDGYPIRKVI